MHRIISGERRVERKKSLSLMNQYFSVFSIFSNPPKHTIMLHICSIPLILLLGFELHSLNIVGFESSVLKDTHLSSDLCPLFRRSLLPSAYVCGVTVKNVRKRASRRGMAEKAGAVQGEQLRFSKMHL